MTLDAAVAWACENNINKCFETSAKTGQAVEEVFSCAGKDIFAKLVRDMKSNSGLPTTPSKRRNSVKNLDTNGGVTKKGGCC